MFTESGSLNGSLPSEGFPEFSTFFHDIFSNADLISSPALWTGQRLILAQNGRKPQLVRQAALQEEET